MPARHSVGQPCLGTTGADRITGTPDQDFIRALAGPDVVNARGANDRAQGGKGADLVRGAGGNDAYLFGGESGPQLLGPYTDAGDDVVRGGRGIDQVVGGYGQGGVDRVFGGRGDDFIVTDQRGFQGQFGVRVTKEFIECGPGDDGGFFDEGVDVVADDCENLTPVPPGGLPTRQGSDVLRGSPLGR